MEILSICGSFHTWNNLFFRLLHVAQISPVVLLRWREQAAEKNNLRKKNWKKILKNYINLYFFKKICFPGIHFLFVFPLFLTYFSFFLKFFSFLKHNVKVFPVFFYKLLIFWNFFSLFFFFQSIALARVFVKESARIIILDEAMGQMDAYKVYERERVLSFLGILNKIFLLFFLRNAKWLCRDWCSSFANETSPSLPSHTI